MFISTLIKNLACGYLFRHSKGNNSLQVVWLIFTFPHCPPLFLNVVGNSSILQVKIFNSQSSPSRRSRQTFWFWREQGLTPWAGDTAWPCLYCLPGRTIKPFSQKSGIFILQTLLLSAWFFRTSSFSGRLFRPSFFSGASFRPSSCSARIFWTFFVLR